MGFALAFMAIAVIMILVILPRYVRRASLLQRCMAACRQLAVHEVQAADIDAALIKLLRYVGTIMEAPAYAIYLYDGNKEEYTMRAVRYQVQEHKNIMPSYSGLSPYGKGICCMPSVIAAEAVGSGMEFLKHDCGSLLIMPLADAGGVMAIGPSVSIRKRDLNCLGRLKPDIQTAIAVICRNSNKGYA